LMPVRNSCISTHHLQAGCGRRVTWLRGKRLSQHRCEQRVKRGRDGEAHKMPNAPFNSTSFLMKLHHNGDESTLEAQSFAAAWDACILDENNEKDENDEKMG